MPKPAEDLAPPVPAGGGVKALREAAAGCRACPLWRDATQTVFGSGPARADLMLIGEQPGDREDRDGKPFVGPAGHLLDRALEEAGIDPASAYKTNVVKHFKFKPRGKRRIHQTPSKLEIDACMPWLDAELDRVRPQAVGLLGATAAKAVLGSSFRVSKQRGELLEVEFAPAAVATYHPSAVLRASDEDRREAFGDLVADLRVLAAATG
ncbi:MAG: UdgX family uracil-DNA binding protein [Solirubrobacterales bacterium]